MSSVDGSMIHFDVDQTEKEEDFLFSPIPPSSPLSLHSNYSHLE